MILALSPLASAQEPPPATEPPGEEIVVYGRLAVEIARDDVVAEMERMGYRVRSDRDDRTILAPPASWMGAAILEPDGTMTFRDPILGLGVPSETWALDPRHEDAHTTITRSDVQMTSPMVVTPVESGAVSGSIMVGATTAIPSKRKRDTIRARVMAATEDELVHLRTVLRATEAADSGAGP